MPTINVEVLKQLLQEFSEKEALTTEEIGVIEQEVANLEKRIEQCRAKLQNLGEDKEKLAAIRERYTSGAVMPRIGIKESTIPPLPKTATTKPASEVASKAVATKATEEEPAITEIEAPAKESELDIKPAKTKPAKTPAPEPAGESEENISEEASSKESGDTIKSINDALKGLFRK